jgi:transcription elongation factor Elf1
VNNYSKKMKYVGFCSHDCEAHYECPVCGKRYSSWNLWVTEENKGLLVCDCGTTLKIPE